MTVAQKMVGTGLLLLVTIGTGLWLSNSGKPLNPILFNAHKFAALAAIIFTALFLNKLIRSVPSETIILAAVIGAALLALTLLATGGLLSQGKPVGQIVLVVHNIATVLLVLAVSAVIYLLVARKGV